MMSQDDHDSGDAEKTMPDGSQTGAADAPDASPTSDAEETQPADAASTADMDTANDAEKDSPQPLHEAGSDWDAEETRPLPPPATAGAQNPPSKMLKGLVVAVAVAAFFAGYSAGMFTNPTDGITEEQLDAILSEIDSKIAVPAADRESPGGPQAVRVSLDDDPMKGDPGAGLTIVEFSDFQCPFCSRFYEQTLPLIERDYIDTGKVNFVYRDFPLQFHQNAVPAHIAAECADEQGMFWPYHDLLFERQNEWQSVQAEMIFGQLAQYAADLKLDSGDFESCLGSAALADEVQHDYADGVEYGVRGTPAFFVGNAQDGYVLISGAQPFEAFQSVIESRLR